MFHSNRIFNLKNNNSVPFYTTWKSINESFCIRQHVYLIYHEWSGDHWASTWEIKPGIRIFEVYHNFFLSKKRIRGWRRSEKKKQKEEDLDRELENANGVAELRERTEAKTSSYGKKFCSDVCWTISAIHFNVMHDSAMKKSTYYFWLC